MATVHPIEGMTCGACRARVETALAAIIPNATVTLDPPEARFPSTVDIISLNNVLAKVGAYKLGTATSTAPRSVDQLLVPAPPQPSWAIYWPLALITAYLVIVSFAGTSGVDAKPQNVAHVWMMNFMAGFFLVFSFFKFLDLKGFASAYQGYDVVAERLPVWGYVYPFVELGLGLAYLFRFAPTATNWVTLVVMGVSIIGVIRALHRKQTIRCACLGTVLNLPMSTVTLVEDGLMIAMAAGMIAMG